MSLAIRVENLGKRYAINQAAGSTSLRDTITAASRRLVRAGSARDVAASEPAPGEPAKEFWALNDVSFDVSVGERIGIIGANGAGKSTLLKILSRVTTPTTGRVEIRGKVASLLEVGTGFHPELSGRENVYLNGAILGMTAVEIRKKFDQIVEFSGVEKFLDTPVKHYSSGMYVRLAFAVSAWLDPDILIVDEVLAVGDAAFQRKCAERMKELTREGRTVLFVSHSMASIQQMCQKALHLQQGRVVAYTDTSAAVEGYERASAEASGYVVVPPHQRSLANPASRDGAGGARIVRLDICGKPAGTELPRINMGGSLEFDVTVQPLSAEIEQHSIDLGIGIDTHDGRRVFTSVSGWQGAQYSLHRGNTDIKVRVDNVWLRPGTYLVSVVVVSHGVTLDSVAHCCAFVVEGPRNEGAIAWSPEHGATLFPTDYSRPTDAGALAGDTAVA